MGLELPPVRADIGMIERVLTNLIENAIKYSHENGTVSIKLSRVDDSVRAVISDTGPGVSEDELPNIFRRYYRARRSGSDETAGSGLGLAIAKKILQLHDSDIQVESEVNEGTTFYFDLKTDPQAVSASQA